MPPPDPKQVTQHLLSKTTTKATIISCKTIQRLWAGYGQICNLELRAENDDSANRLAEVCNPGQSKARSGDTFQLILKLISPPNPSHHDSRGQRQPDEGHLRKMFSYEVEAFFYKNVVPRMEGLGVARCFASSDSDTTTANTTTSSGSGYMAILMADLRTRYPVSGTKRSVLTPEQVFGCLEWLGDFHSRSWDLNVGVGNEVNPGSLSGSEDPGCGFILPPLEEFAVRAERQGQGQGQGQSAPRRNVWLNGGYTYLSTRRKEYDSLVDDHSEWSDAFCNPFPFSTPNTSSTSSSSNSDVLSTAEVAALSLTPRGRPMESLIHGDVKSENLFTTQSGSGSGSGDSRVSVAFFDFQYVGLGLGVCDLAKLFTCSVPVDMLVSSSSSSSSSLDADNLPESLSMCPGEKKLLERYRLALLRDKKKEDEEEPEGKFYDWATFVRHWETALVDWCRFQASWGFWGNTEWLEARVRFILCDEGWRRWVEDDIRQR